MTAPASSPATLPTVATAHPLRFRGSRLARFVLHCFGWRVVFDGLPGPKGVIVAYPHTSNWDFVVGILAKWAMGLPLNFWAKEGLFTGLSRFTLGPLMRAWGAVPVDRRNASGTIARTIDTLAQSDYFWLALSPEGTRRFQDHWRSGFYRVAHGARVPLGLAYFDFAHRVVGLTEFMHLSGDEAADLQRIAAYYAPFRGARPALAAPAVFRPPREPGA